MIEDDEPLTQDQMRNASIAGLAREIAILRGALAEIGEKTNQLHDVFLAIPPGQSDTLADRLLKHDLRERAAEIMEEEWMAKLRKRGLIAATLMTLGAFVTGAFAILLKLNQGGQP